MLSRNLHDRKPNGGVHVAADNNSFPQRNSSLWCAWSPGSIPACLTQLPELVELHLDFNQLTGTIPAFATTNSPLAYFSAAFQARIRLTAACPRLGELGQASVGPRGRRVYSRGVRHLCMQGARRGIELRCPACASFGLVREGSTCKRAHACMHARRWASSAA